MVEGSPGVALAMRPWEAGYLVKVVEPTALDAARTSRGTRGAAASMEARAREADVLVITTPWPVFSSLVPVSLWRTGKRSVIIDRWRVLPKERFRVTPHVPVPGPLW